MVFSAIIIKTHINSCPITVSRKNQTIPTILEVMYLILRTCERLANRPRVIRIHNTLDGGIGARDSDKQPKDDSKDVQAARGHLDFTLLSALPFQAESHKGRNDKLKEQSIVREDPQSWREDWRTHVGAQQSEPMRPMR